MFKKIKEDIKKSTEKDKRELFFIVSAISMFLFSSYTTIPLLNSSKEGNMALILFWGFLPYILSFITLKILKKIVK